MTGYGKAGILLRNKKYIIEIRSLNSKQLDLTFRLPAEFRDSEIELRSQLSQVVVRGKAECSITTSSGLESCPGVTPLNMCALDYYMCELNSYATSHNYSTDNLLATVLRLPDVLKSPEQTGLSEEESVTLKKAVAEALDRFNDFRRQEGQALQNMFNEKLNGIITLLEQVEPLESERVSRIRGKLEESLNKLSEETRKQTDKNRLEQEMIYYLEKLDITEEKVRLRNHICYFFETMNENQGVGKKLGFVAQEMGREINTLGSKSNQAEMQIIVVKMKDLLEQIKEQVLNVL